MPIYAYRCAACGFAKDVLQKVSDTPLTECVACGQSAFKKQLTAAGFQLKGTGWYATDFRGGAGTAAPAVTPETAAATPAEATGAASTASAATPAASSSSSDTSSAA